MGAIENRRNLEAKLA